LNRPRLEECPDLEGIETYTRPDTEQYLSSRLEECPDLEGIETILRKYALFLSIVSLEECPDLEGIETTQRLDHGAFPQKVWRSAPT